jgi:hypothetical protein
MSETFYSLWSAHYWPANSLVNSRWLKPFRQGAQPPLTDCRLHKHGSDAGILPFWWAHTIITGLTGLAEPLRFHSAPHRNESIVDAQDPNRSWSHDHSKPFSERSDDALLARFRNPSTNRMAIIIISGLYAAQADCSFANEEHGYKFVHKKRAGASLQSIDGNPEVH